MCNVCQARSPGPESGNLECSNQIVCPLYPMRSTLVRILSWSGEAKQQFVAAEEEEEEEGSRPWTPLWLWPMAPPLRPTPPVHGTNLPGAHC